MDNKFIPIIKTRSQKATSNKHPPNNKSTQKTNSTLLEIENKQKNEQNCLCNSKLITEENKRLKTDLSHFEDNLLILGENLITDSIISKYFGILNTKIVDSKEKIFLMDPAVVQGIKTLNDINTFLEPMKLMEKDIIIVPINDYVQPQHEQSLINECDGNEDCRGSHWSILLFYKHTGQFYHYDSSSGKINLPHAEVVSSKLANYLKPKYSSLKPITGPTQKNHFDCGVFSLIATDYILLNAYRENFFNNLTIPESDHLSCIKKRSYIAYILKVGSSISKNNLIQLMSCPSKEKVKESNFTQEDFNRLMDENKQLCNDLVELKNFYNNGEVQSTRVNVKLPIDNSFAVLEKITPQQEKSPHSSSLQHKYVRSHHSKCQSLLSAQTKTLKTTDLIKDARALVSKKITLMTDSQGKDLANYLHGSIGNTFNVHAHVQPGAPLSRVVESIESSSLELLNKEDWVITIGGCNDISNLQKKNINSYTSCFKNIINSLENQIEQLKNTNLIIATIPYRYDLHNRDQRHGLVAKVNCDIRNLVHQHNNVHLLDLYLLEQFYHTKHGFHISRRGKRRVSQLIEDIIMGNGISNRKTITFNSPTAKSPDIEVVEQNMSEVIKKHKNDNSVAFAHCISGDFGHERQMTAGVAVMFKREFGRPTIWDCIDDHLAYQKIENGVGIFSLVTKLNYNGKPQKIDYDKAFKQLTTNIKKENFKLLICSALGCVRDKIPLQLFVSSILNLHNYTGAKVKIVVCKQNKTRRDLYSGLSHGQFVYTLKKLLAAETSKSDYAASSANDCTQPTVLPSKPLVEPLTPVSALSTSWHGWPSLRSNDASTSSTPKVTPGHLQFNEVLKKVNQTSESVLLGDNQKQSSIFECDGSVLSVNLSANLQPTQHYQTQDLNSLPTVLKQPT